MVLSPISPLLRKRAETTWLRDNVKPAPLETAILLYRFYDGYYFQEVVKTLAGQKISPN